MREKNEDQLATFNQWSSLACWAQDSEEWKLLAKECCGAVLFLGLVVSATQAAEDLGLELARAFIGECVQNLPNTDKIENRAKAFNLKPLTGDMAAMLAPQDKTVPWKGWIVNQAPAPPYFLYVSEAEFQGSMMRMCGIANPYAPEQSVVSQLEKMLSLGTPIGEDTSAGQRTRVWQIQISGASAFISITDATPMGQPGLTMNAMMNPE